MRFEQVNRIEHPEQRVLVNLGPKSVSVEFLYTLGSMSHSADCCLLSCFVWAYACVSVNVHAHVYGVIPPHFLFESEKSHWPLDGLIRQVWLTSKP